jgi:acid phosphatase type 7
MKKLSGIFALLSLLSVSTFLFWLFRLHGTGGIFHIEYIFRIAVFFLLFLGILPVITLISLMVLKRQLSRLLAVLITIISLVAIVIPVFAFPCLSGFPPSSLDGISPRLFITPVTGTYGIPDLAVDVWSKGLSRYTLTWGTTDDFSTINEKKNAREHTFILHNLEPATVYWYRINNGSEYRFTTPDTASTLHFAVDSDAHIGSGDSRPDLTSRILAQIADPANNFDYVFSLGDNVEYGFRTEEWQTALTAFSATSSTIPSAFAPGNHDALFTGLNRYLDYCSPAGIDYGNGTRLWHRIDVGSIHFLVLDVEWSAESITASQQAWFENELKSIPASDWTIVMSHCFYYASGSVVHGWKWYDNPETLNKLVPLFEKYGVDFVFSGHDHQMELLEKSGVTYVITGAFGGIPDPARTYTSPASLWYASGQYGYVDVTIDARQAQITFCDPDGRALKTEVISK